MPRSIALLTREWADVIRRDSSHPCVVAWVPLNESWGVRHVAVDPRQQAFVAVALPPDQALDGTRPVISNDGWEHTAVRSLDRSRLRE